MSNDIIEFLDIKDEDLEITEVVTIESTKYIHLEKKITPNFCEKCKTRMYSRGIKSRSVKHPILQNGYQLVLKIKQRRWRCQNKLCLNEKNDEFEFVGKGKQTTNFIPYMIINELKDLNMSARSCAKRFNISDTTVRNYFLQHVEAKRLPLPKYLSIDEVYLDIDEDCKYSLILMNFETKEIVDILEGRRDKYTRKYFYAIPLEERKKVEYLICDMYNPYVNFTKSYFRNAKVIIDSFHVVSWLINKLNLYINQVKKRYQNQDKKRLEDKNYNHNFNNKTIDESKEVYLLKKYKWVLLKNKENINYSTTQFYEKKLCRTVDTYSIIDLFLSLDSHFEELRDLKELYIEFNSRNRGNLTAAKEELLELIVLYEKSKISIFCDFAILLKRYYNEIINSFEIVKQGDHNKEEIIRRLSNGPIESFNRKPKDYKRNSRGVRNFEFTRLRLLLATRSSVTILGTPKPLNQVLNKPDKTTQSY